MLWLAIYKIPDYYGLITKSSSQLNVSSQRKTSNGEDFEVTGVESLIKISKEDDRRASEPRIDEEKIGPRHRTNTDINLLSKKKKSSKKMLVGEEDNSDSMSSCSGSSSGASSSYTMSEGLGSPKSNRESFSGSSSGYGINASIKSN